MSNIKIGIIGRGNVGSHLANALSCSLLRLDVAVLDPHSPVFRGSDYDLLLISVSDSAINDVATRIEGSDRTLIAHTSGSVDIDILIGRHARCGVFYPLQTFTKGVSLDYSAIPFFVEASDSTGLELLKKIGLAISNNVFEADSDKRRKLHLASVFACNFVNHLYSRAWQLLEDASLPSEAISSLIAETSNKILRVDPRDGQTGPAARGDRNVIAAHLEMLAEYPEMMEEYRLLSEGIMKRLGK